MARRISCLLTFFVLLGAAIAQESQSSLPDLPPDIPKDAVIRMVLSDKSPSGQDAVWISSDGAIHEFYQFNDRGRGPKIYTTYRVDAHGLLTSEESKGVDYMKSPIEKRFTLTSGQATWKNQGENDKLANSSGKFYIDIDGGPEASAVLARALLAAPGNNLPVLPSGTATIRKLQSVVIDNNYTATLYEINGLAFTPDYIWLDDGKQFFAGVGGWSSVILKGYEAEAPKLRDLQRQFEVNYEAELAKKLTHKPAGDLVITNASLFDSETMKVVPGQRVTVHGDHIASVEADRGQGIPPAATVIDGKGKMLLPGLWDMHAHLFAENAYLDIATGVTTIRDMGNSIDELTKLRQQIDGGTQIGPRVVLAGFIDGPGPYEGPIKVLAATPEKAKQRVDRYFELGYVQIKIYSSVKPELVPIIATEAHRLGMRVSGHVPAGMTATQFVLDGADEIQHMNFVFLNFWPDVKETRTPARFIEPGKRGADLNLNSQQVNDFIALLKQHHTVIDPTMGVWESTYTARAGEVSKLDAPMFARMPVQVQRGIKAGDDALTVPDAATDKQYRASYANMVRMVKKLYDNGIQIVAGTDAGNGYAFDRELEIYNEAGIPASEVLRMATLEAATVMKKEKELGSITPGKFADIILVSGDPTNNISDVRRVDVVIKNGDVYRPAEMYPAFGIRAE